MRSLLDFAASCAEMPAALEQAQRQGIQKAALHVTKGIRYEILGVTHDMRLSGVGKRGGRVGARYDIKGVTNPTALIKATGPLHLVEHPTSAHEINPRRRKGKRGALKFNGMFSAHAMHPGTRPSRPFARGVAKTAARSVEIFNESVWKATRKAFGQ